MVAAKDDRYCAKADLGEPVLNFLSAAKTKTPFYFSQRSASSILKRQRCNVRHLTISIPEVLFTAARAQDAT